MNQCVAEQSRRRLLRRRRRTFTLGQPTASDRAAATTDTPSSPTRRVASRRASPDALYLP